MQRRLLSFFTNAKAQIESVYSPNIPTVEFLRKYQTTAKKALATLHANVPAKRASVGQQNKSPVRAEIDLSSYAAHDIRISAPEEVYYKNGGLRGVQVHMHHVSLELEKTIVGRDAALLEQKISRQKNTWEIKSEMEQKRLLKQRELGALEQLEDQAESMTRRAQESMRALVTILTHTLSVDDAVDWNGLRDRTTFAIEPVGTKRITYDDVGCPIDCQYVSCTAPQPVSPGYSR